MNRITFAITSLALSGLLAHANAQTWVEPYAPGSTADDIIRFRNGADGSVTAPNPGPSIGISYSTTPASGVGGGWDLEASGSAAIGLVIPLGSTQAQVAVSNQNLNFGVASSGLGQLVGVSVPMTWSATSTITGSDSWVTETNSFRYNFSLVLSNALVGGGNVDLFGDINLTIAAGSTTLYSVTGVNQILGITSITSSIYDNAYVGFNYDPADGPLEITWSGSSTLSLSLLNILGEGNSTFYNVHSTTITAEAIPEPTTFAFLIGGAGLLGGILRRRS